MKLQEVLGVALFVSGLLTGALGSQILFAQNNPGLASKMLFRGDLQNLPGQEALVFTSDWNAGFRLPLHKHPNGHEWTFVVEGEQTFYIEGVGDKLVKAGEVIYTAPNTAHFGRNATEKLSKTVVFRVKDKDQPIMVEVKP